MFKTVYDFTKMFSILFVIVGLCFIFQQNYFLAIIALSSFFVIKVVDSNWAFESFNLPNHNALVISLTYILIVFNLFVIYGDMETSPLMARLNTENQEEYLAFENKLFKEIEACTSAHNYIIAKAKANTKIYASEVKKVNSSCLAATGELSKLQVPENFSYSLKNISQNTLNEFKKIATNLASFSYNSINTNNETLKRIKNSHNNAVRNMKKAHKMVGLQEDFPEDKASFVKF